MDRCHVRDDEGRQRARAIEQPQDATILDEMLGLLVGRVAMMSDADLSRQLTVLWTDRRGDDRRARLASVVWDVLDNERERRVLGGEVDGVVRTTYADGYASVDDSEPIGIAFSSLREGP